MKMQQWRQVGRIVLGAEEEDDDLWECLYLTTLHYTPQIFDP